MVDNNNKKSAAGFFGLPMASVMAGSGSQYTPPKIVLGKDNQGNEVVQNWDYIGQLILQISGGKIELQGFLDLDLEFQTLNDTEDMGITMTRELMIQQLQLKEKDLPRPFCGRKLYIGMLKLKNDGTGQMNSLKQTKFQSWGSFNLLIPYQHELFYPEELTKSIEAIKKTATKDDNKADDIQMEIAQYFDTMSQEKIKNGESPYPTVDCQLFMNDALKEKVVESVKVFNQPNYSYIHQEDCVICYVGTAVKKKPYTDAGGILQPGIQLGVDDIWFFRPPTSG